MVDIVSPQAIKFSNEKIRPTADKFAQLYYQCKTLQDEWFATSMASDITNTSDNIIDGSILDGRTPITGADATNIITRAMAFVEMMDANGVLNTILKPAVNAIR